MDMPARAAAWWEELEDRIAREAQWEWTQTLIAHLEPELRPADPGQNSLLAGVLATKAAVVLHTNGDPLPIWQAVSSALPDYPGYDGQRRLKLRLAWALRRFGQITDFASTELGRDDQDAASMLAAAEAIVERAEEGIEPPVDWLQRLEYRTAPDQQAFVELLDARMAMANGAPHGGAPVIRLRPPRSVARQTHAPVRSGWIGSSRTT